ncbi:MAG: T9SS type A sorting domain-containing protein [Bacteroidota bacterium]
MKTAISLAVTLLFWVGIAQGQTTRTVGGSGASYATLQLAFAAINTGAIKGQIILQMTGSTNETSAPVLYQSGYNSVSSYTSVTIYPTITGVTVSTGNNYPLIDLNGADNVTIDGRVGQTGSTADLTLTGTNTGSLSATVRFLNSAESNLVMYCKIRGAVYSTAMGIVAVYGANTGTGNNNNIIEYCDITNSGSRPINTILFSGTTGRENSGNIIRNNNIYNFFNAGYSSYGVNIASATIGCTIAGNSFYETTTFIPSANTINYNVIKTGTSNEHTITGNYIGGGAPLCGGGAWTMGSNYAHYLCGIYLSAGTGTATTVQSNTIKNINYTSGEDNPWDGIFLFSGNIDVLDNTVGATTGNGSITVSTPVPVAITTLSGGAVNGYTILYGSSGYAAAPGITFTAPPTGGTSPVATATIDGGGTVTALNFTSYGSGYITAPSVIFNGQSNNYSTSHGLINNSTGIVNITGNNFGSITTVGSQYYAHGWETVYVRGVAATTTLSNNLIGSTTTSNSIQASSAAANSLFNQNVYGLYSSGTLTTTITGNTIANLHNAYTGDKSGSRTRGIATIAGSNTIQNNTVRNISSASTQTSGSTAASVIGISQTAGTAGTTQTVTGNTVYGLSNTTTSATNKVFVSGIFYSGPVTGFHTISGNFVHSLSLASGINTSEIEGIELSYGVYTCANNIVNLGALVTADYIINGILDGTNTTFARNIFFNTVYIGGTVTSGSAITTALKNTNNTATRDFRNNILISARSGGGKHYAIYLTGNTSLTCNYNDYWATGANGILGYLGADKTNLTDLRAATGGDGNSLNTDPSLANAGGTAALDYYASATLPGTSGTGITTDYSGVTRGATPKMGALEGNSYVWQGGTSTDFNTASNWTGNAVPTDGSDISFVSNPSNHCILDQNRILKNITNGQADDDLVVNGFQLTITGNLVFTNGAQINASTGSSVVVFAGPAAQSIPSGAFISDYVDGLTLNNSNGLTLNGNLTVAQTLTLTSGTFTIGANTLTLNGALTVTSGSLTGGATSNITFGGSGASASLPAITLNNLTLNRSNGISLSGSVNVAGTLALASGTLIVGANTLTLSGSSPTSSGGLINGGNASATVLFTNSSAIILPSTFFSGALNNLTLSGSGGVTAGSDISVNGVVNLAAANPSATKGLLDLIYDSTHYPGTLITDYLHSYILNMGATATTTGTGDVTGTVKRATIVANTPYTFGHQYTTISLTTGNMPSALAVSITMGRTPGGTSPSDDKIRDAIMRTYEIVPTGGSNCFVTANFHYLDNELASSRTGFVNTEIKLTTMDYDIDAGGHGALYSDEHGRANYDYTNKYIGLSSVPISYFIQVPASHEWRTIFTLRNYGVAYYTWNGSGSTDWNTAANWTVSYSGAGVPNNLSHVIIPDAGTTPNDPVLNTGNTTINTLSIENGGALIMGSNTLTIENYFSGGWEDQNPLGNDPGTSKVIFNRPNTTISGNARFYNVDIAAIDAAVDTIADITNQAGSTMKIAGVIRRTGLGTGKWYADVFGATVEYNGGDQGILLPDGSPQYHNLTLSGSGTKIMPESALSLHNNFSILGASVTARNTITVPGNLTVGAGGTFATGAFVHAVGGSIWCDGAITSAGGAITCNGAATQFIEGAGTATFNNLTVDNAVKVILANDALTTVTGTLLINSGKMLEISPGKKLTVSGTLTNSAGSAGLVIKSDATGTGSLIHSGSVTGTVERYIAHDFKWHFLSAPVATQPLWPQFAPTPAGSSYSDYTWGADPVWGWDFYYWNPNSGATTQLYWVNLRNTDGSYNSRTVDGSGNDGGFGTTTPPAFTVGRGYLTAYDAGWNPVTDSPIHLFTGTLNAGPVSGTITNGANPFNLVGNPYPSSIDWQAGGWDRTKLVSSGGGFDYWIFNDTDGNYGLFNSALGSGTHGTSRDIAPMQGFFVEAASTGTLDMTSSTQVHSTQTWLKESLEINNLIRLKLTTDVNNYNDEMIIAVDPSYADAGSQKFWSMYTEAPEIYSMKNGSDFSIDRMPSVNDGTIVNLGIKAGVVANYALTVTGLNTFFTAKSVTLEDLKTGTTRNLNENNVYAFNAGPDDAAERFHLHFTGPFGANDPGKTEPVRVYTFENTLYIGSNTGPEIKGDVYIYDMLGRLVKQVKVNGNQCQVKMDGVPGYYVVTLVMENRAYNIKVFLQ